MLLVECNVLEQVKVINEGTKGKTKVRLQGKFQKCDEQNNNGRIYPKSILESQVKAIQEKIGDRSLVGALDHPTNDAIHLSQASHLITKLWVEKNGDVMGECEILSTPNGKIVEALLNDGVKLGISSRGIGSVTEGIKGKLVNEDFKLITFDLVSDPSTRGAFPQISESMRENSERAQKIVSKHKKDRVLLTMLESKISEALKGKRKKLDKNKNGKLDSEDFKMLRGKKSDEESMDEKSFPDLSGDGKVTKKDVLMGRGVIKKSKKKAREGYDLTGEASEDKENARLMAAKKKKAEKAKIVPKPNSVKEAAVEALKKVCWGDRYDESKMSDRDVQRQERRRQPNKKRFESPSNFAAMTGSHYSDRGRGSVHPDGSMQHPEDIEIEDKRGERLRKRKALQAKLGEAVKKAFKQSYWSDRYDEGVPTEVGKFTTRKFSRMAQKNAALKNQERERMRKTGTKVDLGKVPGVTVNRK